MARSTEAAFRPRPFAFGPNDYSTAFHMVLRVGWGGVGGEVFLNCDPVTGGIHPKSLQMQRKRGGRDSKS